MERSLILLLFIPILRANAACPRNIDPCLDGNYETINDPTRSSGYILEGSGMGDNAMTEEWYRPNSGAGIDMPTEEVFTGQCNAYAPIWLNGPIPDTDDDIVNVTACASFLTDNCVRQYSVAVKNCGDFRVYCLGPTLDTYDRWCIGSESACPEGQSSPTGFTPCEDGQGPNLDLENNPVITVDVAYAEDLFEHPFIPGLDFLFCKPYYVFNCSIEHDDDAVFYDVEWFADGTPIQSSTGENAIAASDMPANITSDLLLEHDKIVGTTVTCRVNARATNTANSQAGASRETEFYTGATVPHSSQFIELVEGGPHATYSATYNIPYRCQFQINPGQVCTENLPECSGIEMGIATTDSDSNECTDNEAVSIKVDQQNDNCLLDSNEFGLEIEVHANIDHTYNPRRQWVLQLVSLETQNDFWEGYVFPRAVIGVNDTEMQSVGGKKCRVSDDPHIKSFDSSRYTDVQMEGAFIFYRHTTLPITVEVFFKRYSNSYTSNCGGAVRSGGEVFVFDACSNDLPVRVVGYGCDGGVEQMTITRINDYRYKIVLPTGTTVILGRYYQEVIPSVFDWGRTEGLCGNLNGIDTDEDDKIIRGTNTADTPTPSPVFGTYFMEYNVFSNSWRAQDNESLYYGYVRDEFDYDDTFFCLCHGDSDNPGALCSHTPDVKCLAGGHSGASGNDHDCTLSRRKKRSAFQESDFIDAARPMFSFDPNFIARPEPWTNGWTPESATEHCELIFAENAAIAACRGVPNVNPEGAIENCIADIGSTGETDLDDIHLEATADSCLTEVAHYVFEPETEQAVVLPVTPDVAIQIQEVICPRNCMGRGACEQGVCRCDPGYSDTDCSIDLHHIPTLFNLPSNGTCNTVNRPCELSAVYADMFVLDSVYCKLQMRDMDQNALTDEIILEGEYIHVQKAICPIALEDLGYNELYHGPYIIDISASNNRVDFSAVEQIIVFDGDCWNCLDGQCGTMPNTCHTSDACYLDSEVPGDMPCYVCDGASEEIIPQPNMCHTTDTCYSDLEILGSMPCYQCDGASGQIIPRSDMCHISETCYMDMEVPENMPCYSCDAASGQLVPRLDMCHTNDTCYLDMEVPENMPCYSCDISARQMIPRVGWCHVDDICIFGGETYNGAPCYVCDAASGNMMLQENFCFENGMCFSDGELSPEDFCYQCDGAAQILSARPNMCHSDGACYTDAEIPAHMPCYYCDGASGQLIQQPDMCHVGETCYLNMEVPEHMPCYSCDGASGLMVPLPNMCHSAEGCYMDADIPEHMPCYYCDGASGRLVQQEDKCPVGNECLHSGEVGEDTPCYVCDGTTRNMTLQDSSCYISGVCYENGQLNPLNEGQVCDPAIDHFAWQDECVTYDLTHDTRRRYDVDDIKADNPDNVNFNKALAGSESTLKVRLESKNVAKFVLTPNANNNAVITVKSFCVTARSVKKATVQLYDGDRNLLREFSGKPRDYCLLNDETSGVQQIKLSFKRKGSKTSIKLRDVFIEACLN